jgi:hypothetical protein
MEVSGQLHALAECEVKEVVNLWTLKKDAFWFSINVAVVVWTCLISFPDGMV